MNSEHNVVFTDEEPHCGSPVISHYYYLLDPTASPTVIYLQFVFVYNLQYISDSSPLKFVYLLLFHISYPTTVYFGGYSPNVCLSAVFSVFLPTSLMFVFVQLSFLAMSLPFA